MSRLASSLTLSRRNLLRVSAAFAVGGVVATTAACGPSAPAPGGSAPASTAANPSASAPAPAATPTAAPAAPAATATPVPSKAQVAQGEQAGIMRPKDGTPKKGGIFNMAFGVTVPHYDIYQGSSSAVLGHLYNNLIRYNLVDGLRTIIPDLAESWELSPDGKTYTFHLRQGVQFSDGTPFSADDVVATYGRVLKPPQGLAMPIASNFAQVDQIAKVDDKTVTITMKAPQAFFLEILAGPDPIIYSKKTLDANQGDLRKVIAPGTGAFLYKDYKQAEKWTFVRNPNYWDKELPYVDELDLLHVPNWPDRGTAVLTNQSNFTWNASRDTWAEGEKKGVGVNKLPNFGAYVVYFNCKQKPFDDPRVRRAIHLAVSRQDLIQAFITQEWIDLTRWVPHGDEFATSPETIATLPGYRKDKTEDIATAKKLLADAGYADGIKGVDFLSASVPAHSQIMAPAIQDQLNRTLGIETKIRVQERSLLVEQEKTGKFSMVLDTTGSPIPDFSPIGNVYFKSGASQNWGGYTDPKFDDLLTKSDGELDKSKRRALLDQIQDELDQNPPWLLVGYTYHLPMWQKFVKGLDMDNRVIAQWGRVETVWLDK